MNTRRRGKGEGSITQRPDGRWVARVDLGWQEGKRRRKAVYGRTRREVADKLTRERWACGLARPWGCNGRMSISTRGRSA
jgi:hypothetical protein